jgi:hypothetical protein
MVPLVRRTSSAPAIMVSRSSSSWPAPTPPDLPPPPILCPIASNSAPALPVATASSSHKRSSRKRKRAKDRKLKEEQQEEENEPPVKKVKKTVRFSEPLTETDDSPAAVASRARWMAHRHTPRVYSIQPPRPAAAPPVKPRFTIQALAIAAATIPQELANRLSCETRLFANEEWLTACRNASREKPLQTPPATAATAATAVSAVAPLEKRPQCGGSIFNSESLMSLDRAMTIGLEMHLERSMPSSRRYTLIRPIQHCAIPSHGGAHKKPADSNEPIDAVPAAPLVGIELNPGPQLTRSRTSD